MRTQILVLLSIIWSLNASGDILSRVHPGMSFTDVAIELGRPYDTKVDGGAVLWLYPVSDSQVCVLKFLDNHLSQDPPRCDGSDNSKKIAAQLTPFFENMSSEPEHLLRVRRYCGEKPDPHPGCHISEICVNGGWEEVCAPKDSEKHSLQGNVSDPFSVFSSEATASAETGVNRNPSSQGEPNPSGSPSPRP